MKLQVESLNIREPFDQCREMTLVTHQHLDPWDSLPIWSQEPAHFCTPLPETAPLRSSSFLPWTTSVSCIPVSVKCFSESHPSRHCTVSGRKNSNKIAKTDENKQVSSSCTALSSQLVPARTWTARAKSIWVSYLFWFCTTLALFYITCISRCRTCTNFYLACIDLILILALISCESLILCRWNNFIINLYYFHIASTLWH